MNANHQFYQEKQRFSDARLMLLISLPLLVTFIISIIYHDSIGLMIMLGTVLLILLFTWVLELRVTINDQGIAYQYFPFHLSQKLIPWTDIQYAKVIGVKALKDFGGIGIRFAGKKTGYIINNKFGLEFKNKRNQIIVVSVTQKEEMEEVLRHFEYLTEDHQS